MEVIDQFFHFELENNLFDFLDRDGHRPWEAVRFSVYGKIVNQNIIPHVPYGYKSPIRRVVWIMQMTWQCILYFFSHRNCPCMFMLCSRDKQNGIFFDKISGNVYEMEDKSKVLAIETEWHRLDYKYSGYTCSNIIIPVVRMLYCRKKSDVIDEIYSLAKKQYPELRMDVKEMLGYYHEFKAQYLVYKFLFRYCNTKKIYMVQNGIQKGLMAAAQEQGVEVIEFQHGQISRNHPAYSYPESGVSADMIYHPTKLLTFGPFWHKNRCYPGVENIVIGNDSYADSSVVPDTRGNKRFLVVSNMGEGELLAERVKQILEINSSFHFYFKLHPNQYEEKDYYLNLFRDYSQVDVYTNEYSVNEVLSKVEGVFLIQSTIGLEALRTGRKVFISREGAYVSMDFAFNEKGVYLVNDAMDFVESYDLHEEEVLPLRSDIFVPFNECVARNIIMLNDDVN